jgi:hypothetical protein
MDELTLYRELRPDPPDLTPVQARARARLLDGLAPGRPRPQRRHVLRAAVATAGAGAIAATVLLTHGGGPPAVAHRPAGPPGPPWTVSKISGKAFRVTVRQMDNPAELQRTLRADGVPAYVRVVPLQIKHTTRTVHGHRYTDTSIGPACTYMKPAPSSVPALGALTNTEPSGGLDGTAFVVHPAAIPRGYAVTIEAGRPTDPQTRQRMDAAGTPYPMMSLGIGTFRGYCEPLTMP